MKRFFLICYFLFLLTNKGYTQNASSNEFHFSKLKYQDNYCSSNGIYHKWNPNTLSNKIKSPLFELDQFTIKKNDNKLYFLGDPRYIGNNLGAFNTSFYNIRNKQLALIIKDDFIQTIKNKRSEEISQSLGEYLVFRLTRLDYRPAIDEFKCGMIVASCKNAEDAEELLNRRYSDYSFPTASDCRKCVCQFYEPIIENVFEF